MVIGLDTIDGQEPVVIGQGGASSTNIDNTLESYQAAIEQGADAIEFDLVATKEGVLIAREDNVLANVEIDEAGNIIFDENNNPILTGGAARETTNVADLEQFADRLTVKEINGEFVGGWFSEDFTLEEIKQLRAREPIANLRPQNEEFNDQFEIPTLEEIIDLVETTEAETGNQINLYPKIVNPTYFAKEGTFLNGEPIDISVNQQLIDTLVDNEFTDPNRVYIQSFEVETLIELQNQIMPEAEVDLPLIQLFDDSIGTLSVPYDIVYNFSDTSDANPEIYSNFPIEINADTSYEDLADAEVLQYISNAYAEGIGVPVESIFERSFNIDENDELSFTTQVTGETSPVVEQAQDAGLLVYALNLRPERPTPILESDGQTPRALETDIEDLIRLGVDGFTISSPDIGNQVRDEVVAELDIDSVFGTDNSETLEVGLTPEFDGTNSIVFAGAGDDLINIQDGNGGNLLVGGSGDDVFILSSSDRIFGEEGADRIFANTGGDNVLTGGLGADEFQIFNEEFPESANTITDFVPEVDVIRVTGSDLSFNDLNLVTEDGNTRISANDNDLAVLTGIGSDSLSESDFIFT